MVKAQALADFIAEFSFQVSEDVESTSAAPLWELFVDGASSEAGSGAGVLLITPKRHRLGTALRFKFRASNNEAEYEALLARLHLVVDLGVRNTRIFTDSKLVLRHITGEFTTRDNRMIAYLARSKEELAHFDQWEIRHILRG